MVTRYVSMQRSPGPNIYGPGLFSILECLPSLFQSPLYLKIPVLLQTLKLALTGALSGSPESSKT